MNNYLVKMIKGKNMELELKLSKRNLNINIDREIEIRRPKDPELCQKIWEYLQSAGCYGRENGIKMRDLAAAVNKIHQGTDPAIRQACKDLLRAFHKPVITCTDKGVFIAVTAEEIESFVDTCRSRGIANFINAREAEFINPAEKPVEQGHFDFVNDETQPKFNKNLRNFRGF